jgi:putative peptide zinc metalloprotease protein
LTGTLHSSLWYRVANLKPRLLARSKLHRHRYRAEVWYLLQDPASGRVHRFTPSTRLLLAAMDGKRNVDSIWRLAQRHLGEGAPTQDEVIQLLGQLHGSDLLATDTDPDALELFERGEKAKTAKRRRSWANPMAVRIPLLDPGAFLDRWVALWRALWSPIGIVLWLVAVLPALILLPSHWPDLTGNFSDRVLQADNLLLLAVVFPLIKALHELGHATATRAFGGEVHDMGVMLLVLMPVPYVDASAATVLRSRWHRALIGAAGMWVEVLIAALAFYVWMAAEPGLLRAVCFNVMLVAGLSTLVFNGNPLLRYDAYYILADLIEMPNLAQRAARYWGYLLDRYLLRSHDAENPARTLSERAWFASYGLLSTVYRIFVTAAIALFIGSQFFFIGVILALWAVTTMVGMPILRALRHLGSTPTLRERRGRILALTGAVLATAVTFLVLIPVPYRSQAEGVVWIPEQAMVRAGASGFVSRIELAPGAAVKTGDALVQSVDPALDAQLRLSDARVAELEASYASEFVSDRARAQIVLEQLLQERSARDRARERASGLRVVAAKDGIFTVDAPSDLPGRWLRKGEVIGYVLGQDEPVVRVVVEQAQADLMAGVTRYVGMRFADDIQKVHGGRITRQVPSGKDEAPSRALLASGGGRLAPDPRDPQGRKTLERVFEIDVAPLEPLGRLPAWGQRVFLRFDLEPIPMGVQGWQGLRRVFLRHFNV